MLCGESKDFHGEKSERRASVVRSLRSVVSVVRDDKSPSEVRRRREEA
jgi:hypothetical protein